MSGPIGQGLILLALCLAAAGTVLGYAAGRSGSRAQFRATVALSTAFCLTLLAANGVMEYALLVRDFTVGYVDQVGSHEVPTHIAIVSLWSALEGSILFWGAILALYGLGFIYFTARRPEYRDMVPYTLATFLCIGTFFCFLIAGPANPFLPVTPSEFHVGPNPLLQNHILMVIHPPALYLGYVGMTLPFAMGVASLLRGRLGAGWMRMIRLWMLVPWGFLTCGIVLGGWWAYEVLGWGGYWAWDPVENASFLPWLTATGFLHAAMLMERRGLLKGWTLVLLLSTFALTILGTFMTRSGVFNSVHSFTQSPIGPTFLGFLAIVLVASVLLLGLRVHLLEAEGSFRSLLSRDAAFVGNNLLFVAFTFTVLLGTTFPLIKEALTEEKLTVAEPYFNMMSVPIGVAIVFLMGIGPALPWGRTDGAQAMRVLAGPLGAGIAVLALGMVLGVRDFWPAATLLAAGFAVAVSVRDMVRPVGALRRRKQVQLGEAAAEAFRRGRRRYGGQIVHIGVALMAVSIAVSSSYRTTAEQMIDRGQTMEFEGYTLRFDGVRKEREPHREVVAAQVTVFRGDREIRQLEPRMNRYRGQARPIGTPAVLSGLDEDLYLSAMQIDDRGQFVGLRVYLNPMVWWIWFAAGVMVLGCIVAAWPSRSETRPGSSPTPDLPDVPDVPDVKPPEPVLGQVAGAE